MKYKVGDKVRVREDLVENEVYGCNYFVDHMVKMKGKIVTIRSTFEEEGSYEIKGNDFYWTKEMFEDGVVFEIGDEVRIKTGMKTGERIGGLTLNEEMLEAEGKEVIVKEISGRAIKYEEGGYWYSFEMLERVEEEKIEIIPFDFDKLEIGDKVFDVLYGWLEVVTMNDETLLVKIPRISESCLSCCVYMKDGKVNEVQLRPSIVAIKKIIKEKLKLEDIEEKEFECGERNYTVGRPYKDKEFLIDYWLFRKVYGAKYYTKENAEKVRDILNAEENK